MDSGHTFRTQQFTAQRQDQAGQAQMVAGNAVQQGLSQIGQQYVQSSFQAQQMQMQQQRLMMEDAANQSAIQLDELRRQRLLQDIQTADMLQRSGMQNEQMRALKLNNDAMDWELKEKQRQSGLATANMPRTDTAYVMMLNAHARGDVYDVFSNTVKKGTPESLKAQERILDSMKPLLVSQDSSNPFNAILAERLAGIGKQGQKPDALPAPQEERVKLARQSLAAKSPSLVNTFDRIMQRRGDADPQAVAYAAEQLEQGFQRGVERARKENPGMDEWKIITHAQKAMDADFDKFADDLIKFWTPTK